MKLKSYKFSIIGYGIMGQIHHKALNTIGNVKLDSVFETKKNIQIGKSIKKFNNFDQYLNYLIETKTDGVIISSPNETHFHYASKLIKNKIPILVEKPLTLDFKEVTKLINLAIKYNCVLRCGLIEIYNPITIELKKLKFNNIKTIHITRHSPKVSSKRKLSDVILDLLLHDISLLYHIFSPENLEIIGVNKVFEKGLVETIELLLKFDKKISVFITTSRQSQVKKRVIEIIDNNSIYKADLIEKLIYIFKKGSISGSNKTYTESSSNYKIEPLDRPETAKIQITKFIENIDVGRVDVEHFKLIENSHKFVFKLI